jgi:hypothetical protein
MIHSALTAVIAAAAVMPAAEVEGVPIGARRFGSAMRPEGQPRSYFVSINTDERDRFSPSLALLCTPGKLSLQLIDGHLSSPRSAGAMRVRVVTVPQLR